MQNREIAYTTVLTDMDRVKTRMIRLGHKILEFSVQYEALIRGRWRRVTRFDSMHGSPHRHTFYDKGKEYKQPFPCSSNNAGLTKAQKIIRDNYHSMRSNYLTQSRKESL